MPVGGGFGGKFVLIEPMVAAAALAVGRPVLLHYSRMDDFLAGNPAPDCRISVKLGATREGDITALEARLVFDTGSSGGSPLQIAAILLGGYYRFPNLEIRGHEVLTNKPGAGAYRAPGAQQATFAIESAIDELARKLDLDPLEFRLRNCAVEGDERPNGGAWPRIGLKECLEALREHPAWQDRDAARAQGPRRRDRGRRLAGRDRAGDGRLPARLRWQADRRARLGRPHRHEHRLCPDRRRDVRHDADEIAGHHGRDRRRAVRGRHRRLEDHLHRRHGRAARRRRCAAADPGRRLGGARSGGRGPRDRRRRGQVRGVPGSGISLKEIAGRTMGFAARNEPVYGTGSTAIRESAPGFAAHLVEVEVDEVTGETRPVRYVAVQDVGFAINPAEVEGQIHGGVAQGIGWALYEGMVYDSDGQLLTATLMDYALPRAEMVPPIETVLVEVPVRARRVRRQGRRRAAGDPGRRDRGQRDSRPDRAPHSEHPHQAGDRGHGAVGHAASRRQTDADAGIYAS